MSGGTPPPWLEGEDDPGLPKSSLSIWYHDLYTMGIDPSARFPRDRYHLLEDRIKGAQLPSPIEFREPRPASTDDLLRVHGPDYVDRFLGGRLSDREINRIGLKPWRSSFAQRTLLIMGGSISALEHVCQHGGISGNMAGGTHHSHADFGSGYCVFNDIAVCAKIALEREGIERIAVLDLDVHQGDGTAAILRDTPGALTVSVHCEANFPFRKVASDFDLPLPAGAGDSEYLDRVQEGLDIVSGFSPDVLLFQAGVDALASDALGKLEVSRPGMRLRNQMVLSHVVDQGLPCVIFMGGGYSDPIGHTVDAFLDLFTDAAIANGRMQRATGPEGRHREREAV